MIEAKSITKKFKIFVAVDSISFEPRKGEIFGLLGLNGAGKTTTQRMVCTVFKPTSGDALVNGFSVITEASQVSARRTPHSTPWAPISNLRLER